jgi:hopanoid biosynthesis associated protein HpnK
VRLLIVNADDFGWSSRVNRAVMLAHTSGILTTASLMVAEEGWEEAVQMARSTPSLGVGLHIATTFDRPLLGSDRIPHLVSANGKFEANPLRAGLKYAFSRSARDELASEMEAQFDRFASTGLPWDHIDGHQHFHMHPTVFRHMLALCDRYGVNRLRIPRESLWSHLRGGGDGLTPVALGALVLQLLCRFNLRALRQRKMLGGNPVFVCDHVYGDFQSSNMHTDYTLNLLDRLEGKVCEIYFHPGSNYARKLAAIEQTDEIRDVELKALLDPRVREKAQSVGLKLATYAEAETAITSYV